MDASSSATRSGPLSATAGAALASSPGRSLNAAYQDPSLGYVEVHAHLAPGGVHALLTADTSGGDLALRGHLGELTGWLEERRTPVESLAVLAQPGSASLDSNHARDGGQNGPSSQSGHPGHSGHSGDGQSDHRIDQPDLKDRSGSGHFDLGDRVNLESSTRTAHLPQGSTVSWVA
jgi:hypothetical protein